MSSASSAKCRRLYCTRVWICPIAAHGVCARCAYGAGMQLHTAWRCMAVLMDRRTARVACRCGVCSQPPRLPIDPPGVHRSGGAPHLTRGNAVRDTCAGGCGPRPWTPRRPRTALACVRRGAPGRAAGARRGVVCCLGHVMAGQCCVPHTAPHRQAAGTSIASNQPLGRTADLVDSRSGCGHHCAARRRPRRVWYVRGWPVVAVAAVGGL